MVSDHEIPALGSFLVSFSRCAELPTRNAELSVAW